MKFHGIFLTNSVTHYTSSTGLAALKEFDSVELQISFNVTKETSAGHVYASGGIPPMEWLKSNSKGIEIYGYVNVWHPTDINVLGPAKYQDYRNPYWFWQNVGWPVDASDWYLYGKGPDGKQSRVLGKTDPRPFPDPTIAEHRQIILREIVRSGVRAVRFDDGNIHHAQYWPWDVNKTELEINEGMFKLYDDLKNLGIKVVVNCAWEPDDPDAEDWVYSAAPHVDGVMIEYDVDSRKTGFNKWSDGKFWSLTEDRYRRVARDWRNMGKEVMMVVRWNPELVNKSYQEYCMEHINLAISTDSILTPSKWNYNNSGWIDLFKYYQNKPPVEVVTFNERVMEFANESQLISENPTASLTWAMASGDAVDLDAERKVIPVEKDIIFSPTGNEDILVDDEGLKWVVQRAGALMYRDGTKIPRDKMPRPRVYLAPTYDFNDVSFYRLYK